ncbi:5661_t:CDS:2 [Funneliformis geosporum]|uniref:5661_t:CDS:1 n=1 Tax=Funneliformis geosporum TaxID=1117311 RepID=A0A9W4SFA6_9GLOM|nr:5661_t:CDS:2 [Funneliformis geosporum]
MNQTYGEDINNTLRICNVDVNVCLYKIHDDSVRPKYFLDADNEDEIKAILLECKGHFLYKIIDEDESLHPVIDFDLPIEILNAISPKISYI